MLVGVCCGIENCSVCTRDFLNIYTITSGFIFICNKRYLYVVIIILLIMMNIISIMFRTEIYLKEILLHFSKHLILDIIELYTM